MPFAGPMPVRKSITVSIYLLWLPLNKALGVSVRMWDDSA